MRLHHLQQDLFSESRGFKTGVSRSEDPPLRQEAPEPAPLRGSPLSQEGRRRRPSKEGSCVNVVFFVLSLAAGGRAAGVPRPGFSVIGLGGFGLSSG